MRVLVVSPGPMFSVEDVYQGWVKGLRQAGAQVGCLDLGMRQDFFYESFRPIDGLEGHWVSPYDEKQALLLAADQMFGEIYKGWPDVVVIVSAMFVPWEFLPIIRTRGQKVVTLFTESPYEDDQQARLAEHCDLAIVNDPQNLSMFPDGSYYQPHSFDPDRTPQLIDPMRAMADAEYISKAEALTAIKTLVGEVLSKLDDLPTDVAERCNKANPAQAIKPLQDWVRKTREEISAHDQIGRAHV